MNCNQAEDLICQRLDGETNTAQDAALDAHLAECAACRTLLAELRSLDADIKNLPQENCDALCSRVMEKVRQDKPQKRKIIPCLATAAALAIVLFAGYQMELFGPQTLRNNAGSAYAAPEAVCAEEACVDPAAELAQERYAAVLLLPSSDGLSAFSYEKTTLGRLYAVDADTFAAMREKYENSICYEYGEKGYYILVSEQ